MNPYLSYESMYHVPTLFSLSWYVCRSTVEDAELKQQSKKKLSSLIFSPRKGKKGVCEWKFNLFIGLRWKFSTGPHTHEFHTAL